MKIPLVSGFEKFIHVRENSSATYIIFSCKQAYSSYMKGNVSFELQNWKEALELFGQAR